MRATRTLRGWPGGFSPALGLMAIMADSSFWTLWLRGGKTLPIRVKIPAGERLAHPSRKNLLDDEAVVRRQPEPFQRGEIGPRAGANRDLQLELEGALQRQRLRFDARWFHGTFGRGRHGLTPAPFRRRRAPPE